MKFSFVFFGIVILCSTSLSSTIYVPDDYQTIQEAISASFNGDTVIVKPGTYIENITFLGKAITVESEQGATVTTIDGNQNYPVVMFINNEGTDSVINGFTLTNGLAPDGGGVYCPGSSPTIMDNTITLNNATYKGGGIYCVNSSAIIDNNDISYNSSNDGAGIYYDYSSLAITNNILSDNTATDVGGGIYCYHNPVSIITGNTITNNLAQYGGGISCYNGSDPVIADNSIIGNSADEGGGIYCYSASPDIESNDISNNSSGRGGGIYCTNYDSVSPINDNWITNNVAPMGGGICCDQSSPEITNNEILYNDGAGIYFRSSEYTSEVSGNTISYNSAGEGAGICCDDSSPDIKYNVITMNTSSGHGGGITCAGSTSVIEYNLIAENWAAADGGGIRCSNGAAPTIVNCTLAFNTANNGGGIHCHDSDATIKNSILWENTAPTGPELWIGDLYSPSEVWISYSDLYGAQNLVYIELNCALHWGSGMIGDDIVNHNPLFVNPSIGQYELQAASPCIDAGDPDQQYNDPDGTRNDMGAYYHDQSGPFSDLVISTMVFDPSSVDPNTNIAVTYTVENIGGAPGGSSQVGFFLSKNSTFDPDDIFLGEETVPTLNPGDTFTSTNFPIAVGDNPGNWFLLGYADWQDSVTESNEQNNLYDAGQLTINSLWNSANVISQSLGGQVTFDLRAGNGYERRRYFLLGSISGTSPGTVLPGGNVLPLNRDVFTEYILKYFNYTTFDDFRGWFDWNGEMTATLDVQPNAIPAPWVGEIMTFAFTTELPYDFQSNTVDVEVVP